MNSRSQLIKDIFNEFNGKNLSVLDSFYSPSVVFQDPAKTLQGLDELKEYYQHAYKNVESIRFEFLDFIIQDSKVAGSWVMTAKIKGLNFGRSFPVSGLSVFDFDSGEKVISHRDYFDLGEMVYEKIPVLGIGIKKIRSMLVNK